jgi:hypothetical protein
VDDERPAEMWLADQEQRAMTVYPGGRLVFQDGSVTVEWSDIPKESLLRLLQQFRDGEMFELSRVLQL